MWQILLVLLISKNNEEHAIRPEHVTIVQKDGIKTVVESMEFRGSVYRTEVRVVEENTHLYNEKIVVDILASEVEVADIRKGKPIQISFSENHMLSYGKKVIV